MKTKELTSELLDDMASMSDDMVRTISGSKLACQRVRVASILLEKKFAHFRKISAVEMNLRRSNANKNN